MIVFEDMNDAALAALELREKLNSHLALVNLSVGGGIHCGAVVEGLIGTSMSGVPDMGAPDFIETVATHEP